MLNRSAMSHSGQRVSRLNPAIFFYVLSGVVSLVGLNVHFGVTLYLSRLTILIFILLLLVSFLIKRRRQNFHVNKTVLAFAALFFLIILQHYVSVIISDRVLDGLRQIFIYASVMTLFVIILNLNLKSQTIIRGLKIFLAVGFLQALYGIYQVFGGPFGVPTYQSFIFWPTSGDKTIDGLLYSGSFGLFRASGFFPGDVSHYAAYMSTVIVLIVSFIINEARSKYLHLALFLSVVALVLSLSRSGLLALLAFGLPAFFLVSVTSEAIPKKTYSRTLKYFISLMIVLIIAGPAMAEQIGVDIFYLGEVIIRRMTDLVSAGVDKEGSMGIHIQTRLMAINAFESSPFFGVGLGVNASPWFSEVYNAGWSGSHSHHLDILGQTGFLGAALEWIFMALVVHYMWRGLNVKEAPASERSVLAGLLAIVIMMIFGNLLYHYFLNDFVWYFLATGTALSRATLIKYSRQSSH